MTIELKIPEVGESVQEVQIGKWLKNEGDEVELDENVVELETDKASMDLPAPAAGVLKKILKQAGDSVSIGEVIGHIEETEQSESDKDSKAETGEEDESEKGDKSKTDDETEEKDEPEDKSEREQQDDQDDAERSADRDSSQAPTATDELPSGDDAEQEGEDDSSGDDDSSVPATPAARRALREHGLSPDEVSFKGDRLRPKDVERHVRAEDERPTETADDSDSAAEEVVPMSLIRRRIASRLVEAQQQAALLTTFNEIDMGAVIELRREYRERFEQQYGIDLGYMPFFVKAVIDGLRNFPELNAEIRGDNVVYRNYYHVGVAIGGDKGLVVPVLRYAERMSFAEIEEAIDDFATRAGANKLEPDELEGGTFTITNGGIFGSLLSTPIVNPPQSGVLGMHAIQQRPVAVEGEVVIRPMMYVALTYDHRLVDGREAVSFLKRIKEAIEEPARMLLEV